MSLKDLLAGVTVTLLFVFMGFMYTTDKEQDSKSNEFMNEVRKDMKGLQNQIIDLRLNSGDRFTRKDQNEFADQLDSRLDRRERERGLTEQEQNLLLQQHGMKLQELDFRIKTLESKNENR